MISKRENTAKVIYIICMLIIFSLGVTWVDAVIQPPYVLKIAIKIIVFLLIPIIYLFIWKSETCEIKRLFKFNVKGFKSSLILASVIYGAIVCGFFLTRNIFDFSMVTENLTTGMGIDASNFIYVAIYITFFNSLLEEFFFRGFGFMLLKNYVSRLASYLVSPLMFAIYHMGMTADSYHPLILCIMLSGLFAGGLIFNFLNEKYENVYQSWFVHTAADAAIMTVGAVLFGFI